MICIVFPLKMRKNAIRRTTGFRTRHAGATERQSRSTGNTGSPRVFRSLLKCPMNPPGKNVHRPALKIVGGLRDELIVDAEPHRAA